MTFRKLITEEVISIDELEALIEKHDIVGISAFRETSECDNGEAYSKSDNIKRSREMKKILKTKGYKILDTQGQWTGGKEKSFILIDTNDTKTLRKFSLKLAEKFSQDAILVKEVGKNAELVSTNECPNAYPGFGKKGIIERLGKYKRGKAEFYTTIGKESFHFA